ncbi:MAG: VapC toxin family PIN domain ribonuclease [Legionellales bacterium]|nr:MAG: VapC toxin family PIN domain ribonuclease [Legionellales bacterium]
MHILLDTNICIYIIKKHPLNIIERFTRFNVGDIAISSVTYAELCYGVVKSQHKEKNKAALYEFCLPLEVLPFDDKAASHYAFIRNDLERKGEVIGSLEMMIAAHALSLDVTLITNNEKEFCRVQGLNFENWV